MDIPLSDDLITVRSLFVRHRNCLWVEAEMGPIFNSVRQHHGQLELGLSPEMGQLFRDYLAAFILHGAHQPRNRVYAWTINLQDPLLNLFFAGDTELGHAAGRLFTENVKEAESNWIYQDMKKPGKPVHRSIVEFDSRTARSAIERFYAQSEQRPGRFFHLGDDRYGLLTAHPDWDAEWFWAMETADLRALSSIEELGEIETRRIGWFCGCSHEKILDVLTPVMIDDGDALFGEESVITVNCPRCAAQYRVSREALEHYVAMKEKSGDET